MRAKKKCLDCNELIQNCSKRCIKCYKNWKKIKSPTGKDSPKWLGDNDCYQAIHTWIHTWWEKANKCENEKCNNKCNHYEWSNISGEYKRDRSDWRQLCTSCHRRMDYEKMTGNKCMKGHTFDEHNTYINPKTGRRRCRTCGTNLSRMLRQKKAGYNE